MITNATTISELKRSLTNELTSIFSAGEARSISKLILEHLGFPEISILKEPATVVNNKFQAEIKKIVGELKKNMPIQYILEETEFYGIKLSLDRNVLIPRPETEELVSYIIKENKHENPIILDIGTGSGCIPVALGKHMDYKKLIAIDIDEKAIEVARKNARSNHVDIDFITGSIFETGDISFDAEIDILVSNPPYVRESEKKIMKPNVTEFEPARALFVPDNDPLIFYREIIRFAEKNLAPGGVIWMEINEALGPQTLDLFLSAGYMNAVLLKDIHEKNRFINAMKHS